jgi:hypothetical protein
LISRNRAQHIARAKASFKRDIELEAEAHKSITSSIVPFGEEQNHEGLEEILRRQETEHSSTKSRFERDL